MLIIRYRAGADERARVGVSLESGIHRLDEFDTLAQLWTLTSEQLRALLESTDTLPVEPGPVRLLAPVDGRTEVWAAGVTYEISRSARVEESERAATIYELVYDAARPELFFKSVAWRVVGDGGTVGVRADSEVDVPEPEVAVVVNAAGEIVGYTICDDVSSRSIEGENPLYLPQAKIFAGACALGPGIRPAWEVTDPYALGISMTIARSGEQIWSGRSSTAQLHRRLDELVGYLLRGDEHPDGVVLSAGTSLVPAAPFSLQTGDVVQISVEGLGTLTTGVARADHRTLRPDEHDRRGPTVGTT